MVLYIIEQSYKYEITRENWDAIVDNIWENEWILAVINKILSKVESGEYIQNEICHYHFKRRNSIQNNICEKIVN